MRVKGMRRNPDGCVRVELQKTGQAAAVVIVAMGDNGCVHRLQVDSQPLGIGGESRACPHIEQNALATGLNQQAQPMLRDQRVGGGGVFDETVDFHGSERGLFPAHVQLGCTRGGVGAA